MLLCNLYTGHFSCFALLLVDLKFGPPEFPNVITSDTGSSCSWTLVGSSGQNYRLKLMYFDIPSSPGCRDNSLKVYRNNQRMPENLLETLCGHLSEEEMSIDGGNNLMTVVLEVNNRGASFRGFYGYFEEHNI